MKYVYEDLGDWQFENLVVVLCQRLLGMSVQKFAAGPDGGRDAKFVGTAEMHPSRAGPWIGTTIIQAKHTNGHNRHFSEPDFFSRTAKGGTIREEVPRIKKLVEQKQLDHYMLFSNRRLGAITESEIRAFLATECGIAQESIYLCCVEQLDMFMKNFPDVPDIADIDPVDSPLIVSPHDLSEVVQALSTNLPAMTAALVHPPPARVTYEEKNTANNMDAAYARTWRNKYLKDTAQIQAFLAAPENLELLRRYESIVDDFQLKVLSKRKNHQTFDQILEYLGDLLFDRDPVLRANKRLTRLMLFYMYWNCDIGETPNADTK